MEKSVHIDSKNKNICDVIKHHLYVPVNQRPFSWEKKNVAVLLKDIKLAMGNKEIHFIGTIACRLNNEKDQAISLTTQNRGKTKNQYEIIDGQQRISTIWLFSYAAMVFLKGKKNKFYEEIEKNLYVEENKELVKDSWLMLSGIDEEPFCDLRDGYLDNKDSINKFVNEIKDEVKKTKKEKGQLSVLKSRFLDFLDIFKKDFKNREKEIIKIWKYIFKEKNLQFTFTEFENLPLAKTFEMFSNINTKGMPLSELDKIKSEIFKHVKQKKYAEYSSKWFQFLSKTKGNPEDYLCMYLRANFEVDEVWKRLTCKSFMKILKKKKDTSSFCEELINNLVNDVKIYNSMFSYNKIESIPSLKKIEKDKKFYFEVFRRGNYDYAKPIVYLAIKNKDYNAIANVVSFYFIVKTLGFAGASYMQKSMLNLKRTLYNRNKYKKVGKKFYEKYLKDKNITEKKAIKKFEESYSYNKYKNIMTKPLLAYYQSCLSGPDWSYYNILMNAENNKYFDKDHICPKEPKSNEKFEYYCESKNGKKIIRFKLGNTFKEKKEMNSSDFNRLYLNNIGNLRIYDKDSNIRKSNKSIDANFFGWNSIKKRGSRIATFIVEKMFTNI